MNELLRSLRSDLLDRRLLPVLVALGLALAGAVAYAVLAGGGSPKPVAAAAVPGAGGPAKGPSLPVTQAPANPNAAVAETTEGARYQHRGGSHNPFTPLVSPKAQASTTSSTSRSSSPSSTTGKTGGSTTSGGGSSTPSPGGGTTPSQPTKPAAPKPKPKPKPAYIVSLQFGPLPAPPAAPQLTPYELRSRRVLPSTSDPRIVFAGVHGSPFKALFTLAREAILKGEGTCVPSTSQCESIELPAGKSEQLEYLEPNGQSVVYELKVVSIARPEGAAARIARHHRRRHHHR